MRASYTLHFLQSSLRMMMTNNNTWRKGRSVIYKNSVKQCELVEFNGEENHSHIIISLHSKHALSNVVDKLKGKSAYILRRDHFDLIKHVLWGKHFWSPSYCAVSTGGASLETISNYIKGQLHPS
ncbi:MAG TPA: IS200/IS605 family transposase [Thiothrix sp.]|nr:IS200/IS605 family transposase [Thiothrix sp.]